MTDPVVLAERQGGVAIVTLNRPERRNGLSAALCDALFAQLGQADFLIEIVPRLTVTDASHRRHGGFERITFAQFA